jgi:hypothetical protein
MRSLVAIALLSAISLCCTPQPVVPKPDSSDASALGEAPAPLSPCAQACADMLKAGCIVMDDCATVLQENTMAGRIRNAKTGKTLQCPDIVGVKTAADVQAIGQKCGP